MDFSKLSEEQRQIVTKLDVPLFVEAGAGSGKTFTLTKRVVWALTKGSGADGAAYLDDLSQVLVITFTNAAAREIKERVRAALRSSGPELRKYALQVDSAWISTIHGMCSRILKRHALDLGFDPNFKVVSANEEHELYAQALQQVVGGAQDRAQTDPALRSLFGQYDYGTELQQGYSGILGLVDAIYRTARSTPGGFDGLVMPPQAQVPQQMDALLREVEALLSQNGATASAKDKLTKSKEALDAFMGLAPGARTGKAAMETLASVKLPASGKAFGELLDEAKKQNTMTRLESRLAVTRPLLDSLVELARQLDDCYGQLKRQASVLDNDDLIIEALRAVKEHPEVARDYTHRFRLVMVDEFQDTDQRQLELINILAGGDGRHLATVGDAQQSIYRFRGADVSVFRGRQGELPDSQVVRMGKNFRSHADVLSLVDCVCDDKHGGVVRNFMHLEPNLKCDNVDKHDRKYVARDLPRINVELSCVQGGQQMQEQTAVMAAAIAERLQDYWRAGQPLGGMVLLLGVTTHADLYIDALRSRGMDCVVTGGSTFTGAAETQVMAYLLHTLATWEDAESGLFPLLSSPMFDLDANDFILLGTRSMEHLDAPTKQQIQRTFESGEYFQDRRPSSRLEHARRVLTAARDAVTTMPVADVCQWVVRQSGWLGRLERQGSDGQAVEANVLAALGYIRDLTQELGLGPARAAAEFDVWLQYSKIPPAKLSGGSMDAVRIMTIHASKGLEFPVVAVSECWNVSADVLPLVSGRTADGRRMAVLKPAKDETRKSDDLPQKLSDLDKKDPVDSPDELGEWYRFLRSQNDEESQEEKTRLLYVALTRAAEALVLGISCRKGKEGYAPELAQRTLGALFPGSLPPVGQSSLNYHKFEYPDQKRPLGQDERRPPREDAHVRCIMLSRVKGADGQKGVVVDSGGTLQMGDGEHYEGAAALASLGSPTDAAARAATGGALPGDSTASSQDDFLIFRPVGDGMASDAVDWRARDGVYSYSSAHAQLLQSFQASSADVVADDEPASAGRGVSRAAQVVQDADHADDAEATQRPDDADKATNLGSAFHELAQTMVVMGGCPTLERIRRTADYWRLSERARGRLSRALERWSHSDARRRALAHDVVRAEVPFFCQAHSGFGEYVEGAIDLLSYDRGRGAEDCSPAAAGDHAYLVDYKTGDVGLTVEQVRARHRMQANFYARVLMNQGFQEVSCEFVCVEVELPDGEPLTVSYEFNQEHRPVL
ncbi:MAG: UvrD-helicase domain-containing protein [Coriobacteriales bacterium]|nr:UvrD-helicase domain-containing protein [Coriobacteriales bacterium]